MTRYVPISQEWDQDQQPIRYPTRQPQIIDGDAEVAGRPTRKQQAVQPQQQQQYIKSSQLPRMMDGHIGNVPVKIINVVETMKVLGLSLVAIAIIVLATNMWQGIMANRAAQAYTYEQYRLAIHATNAPCRLDGSFRIVTQQGTIVGCPETSKAPTKDQISQWNAYLSWQACYQFGDQSECDQLSG